MISREDRIAIAKHLLQQLAPEWAQNPRLRGDLKHFVNTGSLDAIQDKRIASLLNTLQMNPQATQNPQYIQKLLHQYGIPIVTGYIQDEQTRSGMTDILSDIGSNPNLLDSNMSPQHRDQNSQQYAQQKAIGMVQGMLGNQATNMDIQRMMAHYQRAGSPSPNDKQRFRQYVTHYLRDTYPHKTEQEIQHLADEQIALIPQQKRASGSQLLSSLPQGCYIPLAFLALFACLGIVQLTLLLAYVIVTPGVNQNPIGSAFNATVLILTVGTSVILWLRHQARSPLHIVRLVMLLGFFGVMIFGMFQTGLIDLEAFTDGTTEDKQRIIGSALLLLSVGTAVVFWVRRQVMNIVWTIVVIAIIIIAIIFAIQSGIIDIDSMLSNLKPTGFE